MQCRKCIFTIAWHYSFDKLVRQEELWTNKPTNVTNPTDIIPQSMLQ